ncbi:plexin-B isoform X1 [Patella vulgata]|uniref:plexin-B isoform X1 n=1 Tax=Patella vulgata TaxID=6465 RepID=UPI0024A7E4DF|nr:plexin-B isoform X1 [Patella vulgata]XP_050412850.2 plexin-B isoform X1 [Patella vulgata]XP_050412851.2 plexin-B isoform X1 [Patella vulgata]XP_055958540.1 plexin-B isoform X1 [Patella vulgata]
MAAILGILTLFIGLFGQLVYGKYLGGNLNKMTIDNYTGTVYIGAVNKIYQLDANLTTIAEIGTGPRNDSPNCLPATDSCSYPKQRTDNYNKILVIDRHRQKLITCGSIYQGACEMRNLDDITKFRVLYDGNSVTDYAVAANEPNASTVAFVAPGPNAQDVLYVGTAYTGKTRENKIYRDEVPALSSRSLRSERFSLAAVTDVLQGKSSSIYLKREVAAIYPIEYVAGFSSLHYSYFLTVQKASIHPTRQIKNITKIVHICQNDPNFFSYADMPLKCVSGNKDYNIIKAAAIVVPSLDLRASLLIEPEQDVLVGLFSRYDEQYAQTDSAICVYSMKEVRTKILENIKLCHQGNTSVSGGGYMRVGPGGNCNQQSGLVTHNIEEDDEYLCNTNLESFSMVVGINPMVKPPAITYSGTSLTSVALTTINEHTVAFVGTSEGELKKIVLETDLKAREYGSDIVDAGSPVKQDMMFDVPHKNIYVMTETNVTRVMVERCNQYKLCNNCLSDRDPYCGWCSLEQRCTLKSVCPNSGDPTQSRWLHGSANQCIYITNITPKTTSVTTVAELHLTIPQLPQTSTYSCVYRELNWSSPAEMWYFGAKCPTPDFSKLAPALTVEGSKTITLALNSSETGKLFVTKPFTFYNCTNFKDCTSCTNSEFECDWCIYDNGCFHDTKHCNENIIRGKGSSKPGVRGALHCPRIDSEQTGELNIPVDVTRVILLKGYNFPRLRPNHASYRCEINTGEKIYEAQAERLDDRHITCNMPKINYFAEKGSIDAHLSVYWGNDFTLEATTYLTATLYKCGVLANKECGLCININYTKPFLNCRWCSDSCQYMTKCPLPPVSSCPAPRISYVWPMSGPIHGGTNVTIEGTNLGAKFEDIKNSVTIASVKCTPYRHLYSPSRRIVCRAEWRGQVATGPIEISINGDVTTYTEEFSYRSPMLKQINPSHGPIAGGSMITISGEHLDTGGVIHANFGDAPCVVDRATITSKQLVCQTTKVWKAEPKTPISLSYDGQVFSLTHDFIYKENPEIVRIFPRKSVASGGRYLNVEGSNFECIQKPQMFGYIPTADGEFDLTEATVCRVVSDTMMKCPTPRLPSTLQNVVRTKRSTRIVTVQLGFKMDGVMALRNLTGLGVKSNLAYYPDPVVFNFTEDNHIKTFKGEMLIIEGDALSLASDKSDVKVMIGNGICNITTLSNTQIVCLPPIRQPKVVDKKDEVTDNQLPVVVVQINNVRYQVGKVQYEIPEAYAFPFEAIAGIAAGGGFLLLIIILILIIYRRQSTKAERIYRKLQIQLDNLESNVRNECKQAFAELQTDMTDLTGDLLSSGIPFWDYHTYTFKVLFPGMTDHVVLHPPLQKNGRFRFSDQGLQMFQQLLNKKLFLLTFIRTLENQRNFSIRDKVNVASLLMIVYQNNMEYATEILKSLLVELLEKSVAGRHPKLMLRRTESVVEKMLTNWLSLCLYKYMKDQAGSPLFILYKAIKLQAEKGPVDYMTGDARYSLSEDRLLREKIEPRVLSLNVEHNGEVVMCRVLDCDTITQAKEKIMDYMYRNVSFSHRPSVQDLDLEWRNGPVGPVLLNDEDGASIHKDGWKKINNLSFYRVPDGANLSLVHKQTTIKSMNGSLDHSVLSVSSAFPIMKSDMEHQNAKVWHLVKHDDVHQKDGGVKMISEIFLTRLLSTKGTLQKYIDDFFRTILTQTYTLPPVIKYLFDFLDDAADHHGITDPDVVHTWKCNSLPLRFWVNIIKNPDFVFDIHKPHIVDSCLSVVAQTFMDSCSTSEHRLGKDSPSNKLLFARDIVHYRKLVEKYFTDIRNSPTISDQDMNSYLAEISRMSCGKFYISSALRELYTYVSKYSNELVEALEQDNIAQAQQLDSKLGQVITAMEGPSSRIAYV